MARAWTGLPLVAPTLLAESQRERVVVTRHGRPAAILIGVEGMDWEHVLLGTDEHFWRLIARRRKERASPLSAVKRRLPDG